MSIVSAVSNRQRLSYELTQAVSWRKDGFFALYLTLVNCVNVTKQSNLKAMLMQQRFLWSMWDVASIF
jgi:hypothetical protein